MRKPRGVTPPNLGPHRGETCWLCLKDKQEKQQMEQGGVRWGPAPLSKDCRNKQGVIWAGHVVLGGAAGGGEGSGVLAGAEQPALCGGRLLPTSRRPFTLQVIAAKGEQRTVYK